MTEFARETVQCLKCRHYIEADTEYPCFPDGIPDDIWSGKVKHTEPYPGDNGYQFEPAEKES